MRLGGFLKAEEKAGMILQMWEQADRLHDFPS